MALPYVGPAFGRDALRRVLGLRLTKPSEPGGELLVQLLRRVVVDGWLRVLSVCRPKAFALVRHSLGGGGSNAPLQTMGEAELFRGGCYDGT